MPPAVVTKARESASVLVRECAPARHDEFVDRFERLFTEVVGPPMDDYGAKLTGARDALEKARAGYIGCMKDARDRDLVPKEACAAQHERYLEREATVRALRSPEARESVSRKIAPAFTRALQPLAADFPECDLRKLKAIPR